MSATTKKPKVQRLDPKSHRPLHAQAEALLRQLIQQKEHRAGQLLPDEVTLAQKLGISRNTLRTAIGRLVAEGRLERRAGIGTRVIEPRVHSGVGSWHSFTREMQNKGVAVETFTITARHLIAPAEVARALQLPPRSKVLCLDRVRGFGGVPVVHFRSYLHPRLRLVKDDDFSRPLYELILERSRLRAEQSLEELRAVAADRLLARQLQVATGTALLRRDRTVLDDKRRPMEFAVVHYRCDRFTLTLNLREA